MKIKLLLLIGLVALSASLVQSTSTVDADALTKSSRIQELHNGREGIELQDRILTHSSMRSLLEEHGGGFTWGNWGTAGSSRTHGQRCQCTTTVINNNNNNNNNGRRLLGETPHDANRSDAEVPELLSSMISALH